MIRRAQAGDIPALAALAIKLWPGHEPGELEAELRELMAADAGFFLYFAGERPVGFAQCQLRRDYVEGTSSSPVGYLEGIYVEPEYRRGGAARQLLSCCEDWAREHRCSEFASDCELTNEQSLAFHLKLGFREANRIICFTKEL